MKWSLRLSVRTSGFHPEKRGSIPLGTTTGEIFISPFLLPYTLKPNKINTLINQWDLIRYDYSSIKLLKRLNAFSHFDLVKVCRLLLFTQSENKI